MLPKGDSINEVRAEGKEGGSGNVDNSTYKLRDHVCDKGLGGLRGSKLGQIWST